MASHHYGWLLVPVACICLSSSCATAGNAIDGVWLSDPWQTAIDQVKKIARPVTVQASWQAFDDQPLSCQHVMLRLSDYQTSIAEIVKSIERLPRFDDRSAALAMETTRLLNRSLLSLENYTAPLGKLEFEIESIAADANWLVVTYFNRVEVAPLNGPQENGISFSRKKDKIVFNVEVSLIAACRSKNLINVFSFSGCSPASRVCEPLRATWHQVKVTMPFNTTARPWQ